MSHHGPGMRCPHCGHPATARTSVQLSPLYREVVYQCRQVVCGHIFMCALEAVRTLSPSAIPNPEIHLPLAPSVRRRELAAQMALSLEVSP